MARSFKEEFKFRGDVALAVFDNDKFKRALKSLCENEDSFRLIHRAYSTELIFNKLDQHDSHNKKFKFGGVCKVYNNGSGDEFSHEMMRCITEMNADVYENILRIVKEGPLPKIEPLKNWPISFVYKDNWEKIKVGGQLWYIDFDNFYPTIATRLGYLSESIMNKYIDDEFKRSRNISLSRLMNQIKVDYFIDGKYSHTITTDRSLIENAYLNVIQYGRNFINYLCEKYRWAVIGRDVDNIIYPADLRTIVIGKYINVHGFDYKRYLAHKISDDQLRIDFDGRIKTYRNKF